MKISVAPCIMALLISMMTGAVLVNLVNANGIPASLQPPYVAPPSKPPTISVAFPENATYGGTSITLHFTVTIPEEANTGINSVVYDLDGSKNTLYNTGVGAGVQSRSMSFSQTLTGLSEGKHTIIVSASSRKYETYMRYWVYYFGGGRDPLGSDVAYSEAVWGYSSEICFIVNALPLRVTISSLENETYQSGDVPLRFTVSEAVSWMGYSLDNQPPITIMGNTTLTGLSAGTHNIKVYANDTVGNKGWSKMIQFTITDETTSGTRPQPPEPSPTTWMAGASALAAIIGTSLFVYSKKRHRNQ